MAEPALSETDIDAAGLAVRLRAVTKVYDNGVTRARAARSRCRKRRIRLAARAFRLRKVDRAAADRGAQRAERGHGERFPSRHAGQDGRHPIGFVFQEPTLMPWASVRENVRLPLKLSHAPATDADSRIEEALAQVGLAELPMPIPANCPAA